MDLKTEAFQVDLSQAGLRMIFKPWEAAAYIDVTGSVKRLSSGQMHAHLLAAGHDISRASVINFCDRMTEAEIFNNRPITGKGGHRGEYTSLVGTTALMTGVMAAVAKKVEAYLGAKPHD